jgi:hypothetical protein
MSSARRSGNEESILAMLERDTAQGLGRKFASPARLAAYGAGGLLVLGLVGMLVWLARDNAVQPLEAVALAQAADAASGARPAPPHQVPAVAAPAQAAAIVDEQEPPAAHASGQHDVPPLVLLSAPHEPPPAPAVHVPALAPAPKQAARPAAVAEIEPKHAAKTSAHAEAVRVHAPARVAAASAHAGAQPTPAKAAKAKKASAQAQPGEQVDSDVALISAVIMHANKRTAEHGPDCVTGANCAVNATNQP